MQIYISTYALSRGIFALDADLPSRSHMFDFMLPGSDRLVFCVRDYDWHTSIEEANDRASKLRDAKISKHLQEIERLTRKLSEADNIEYEQKMAETIATLGKRIEKLHGKEFRVRETLANNRCGYGRVLNVRER